MNDLARREMITWNSPAIWVTHRPAEQPPGDDFVFAGSLAEAIAAARAAAGEKQVHVMGGADLIRQALAAIVFAWPVRRGCTPAGPVLVRG